MATSVDEIITGSLGSINVAAAAAVGAINPLAGQLDAMVALGIGPLQADISSSLSAALSLQATLSLQFTDPFAAIREALQALIELQGSLTAALALPPVVLSVSAELGAAAAVSAALTAKLGAIKLLLDAATNIKIPSVRLAADLAAALSAGPVVLLSFDGLNVSGAGGPPNATLQQVGALIANKFSAPVGSPAIQPTDAVSGIILVTKTNAAFAALGSIIPTL